MSPAPRSRASKNQVTAGLTRSSIDRAPHARASRSPKAAGMMPEHSPVPPEACRGPRVVDQRRTVPTSRRGRQKSYGFWLCFLPTRARAHNACAHVRAGREPTRAPTALSRNFLSFVFLNRNRRCGTDRTAHARSYTPSVAPHMSTRASPPRDRGVTSAAHVSGAQQRRRARCPRIHTHRPRTRHARQLPSTLWLGRAHPISHQASAHRRACVHCGAFTTAHTMRAPP
jgi:hypothetical protein